ncbi:hypothetical protein Pla108_37240 [Botrimarina colliarenosi]|uniref:Dockerin domain-containing protein n=1 Tax=Botrimarina colliarenosi TaxID=2528001 RepID=A0A5C6A6Q0_9BACT|nr:sialidase family protein [Botrimarina colliarenosi]TWT94013.1 hypothetical protein Pla108_37240 [Botrimarina colliarenosi]
MSVFQDVDLSPYAPILAAGDQAINLALAYNDADASDYGEVSLTYLDAAMQPMGSPALFTTLDRTTAPGEWGTRTLSGLVPGGAAHVRVSLSAFRNGSGTARNISYDAVAAEIGDYVPPPAPNVVNGTLVQFNPNGAWSWYQDERAIVDVDRGEILVGSIASYGGLGGEAEDGKVQTSHFSLADRSRRIVTHNDIESDGGGDDHNVPAYLKKQDGDILTFYAAHNRRNGVTGLDDASYYRTFDNDTETWGAETIWHWWPEIPNDAPGSGGTTYSNLFQLSSVDPDGDGAGRIYNIARTQQSPHFMYSDNNGASWEYGGQFTEAPAASPAGGNYVNGYYKYWSNGVDRIDFVATEYHPRDFNTSIYHGYIQDGKVYDSQGEVVDNDIHDAADSFNPALVPSTDDFTSVFVADGVNHSRAWNTDVLRYPDGSIGALFKTRPAPYDENPNVDTGDHRVWYGRFDPATQQWSTHEIARAGARLFSVEQDYTGLGALDPRDPNTIYISTEINPIDDSATEHHEIYKGVTADKGATWTWTAITENSSFDNLRPIAPQWDDSNTAVIWWRGSKFSHANTNAAVVGVILSDGESLGLRQYADATTDNTTLADGSPLSLSVGNGPGAADNAWRLRTDAGNGATVFTADEVGSEDAPTLKTTVDGVDAGVYDIFAYFWVDGGTDWRLRAGLEQGNLSVFRTRGSQHADGELFAPILVTEEANRVLYQAYLGREAVDETGVIDAFIDDGDSSGDGSVWYDGLGYALVTETLLGDFNADGVVNAADYVVWRDNLGLSVTLPNEDPSVSPGAVTADDYQTWRENYGASLAGVAKSSTPTPEPGSIWLVCVLGGCVAGASPSRASVVEPSLHVSRHNATLSVGEECPARARAF